MSLETSCPRSSFDALHKSLYDPPGSDDQVIDRAQSSVNNLRIRLSQIPSSAGYYYAFTNVALLRAGFDPVDIKDFWASLDGREDLDVFFGKMPKDFAGISHYEIGGDNMKIWGDLMGVNFVGQLSGCPYLSDCGGYRGGLDNELLCLANVERIIPEKVDVISAAKVFEIGSGCKWILPPDVVSAMRLGDSHYLACTELLSAVVNRLKVGGFIVIENSFPLSPAFLKFLGLTDTFIRLPYTKKWGKEDEIHVLQFCPEMRDKQMASFPYYPGKQFFWEGDEVKLVDAY